MSLEEVVNFFKYRDLSGQELQRLIGKPPVLYSDLAKISSLEQLLGKEKYCVILYQTSNITTGHFVAITQGDNGVIRYNEPYGMLPSQVRDYCKYDDPFPAYIIRLLQPYQNIEYNQYDYQGRGQVADCGRWATIFCRLRNVPMLKIRQLFTMNKSQYLNDHDNACVLLTLMGIHNIEEYLTR